MVSSSLGILRYKDWRVQLEPLVMASDAWKDGPRESAHSGVVVFDFFAGIGGLLRSLVRAGLKWEHHVVVESDKNCRRCIRRTWPGGFTNVAALTRAQLFAELGVVDNVTLVVAGGGSPCQGLSLLNSERQHFKDARSKLFFDLAWCLEVLQVYCKERAIPCVGFVENVHGKVIGMTSLKKKKKYRQLLPHD